MSLRKFLLLLSLLACCALDTAAQDTIPVTTPPAEDLGYRDPRFSVELYFNSFYPLVHSPEWLAYQSRIRYSNAWSYGGGILLSKFFHDMRVSAGIGYSKFGYRHKYETTTDFSNDRIEYLHIPLMFSYTRGMFNPVIGCVFSKPYQYNNINDTLLRYEINKMTWFPTSTSTVPPDNDINCRFGWSASIFTGLTIKVPLTRFLNLSTMAYYSYKTAGDVFVSNTDSPENRQTLYDGHSSVGISIGFEFVFLSGRLKE
jgi:hypothetical protein